ncbi:MAG: aldehyde dehydrogenase family protein [Candidatus Limnocylindrales bacterium]
MLDRENLYIDGAWVAPRNANRIDVIDPATEGVIGRIPSATAEEVDAAVRAAAAAQPAWAATAVAERAAALRRIADELTARTGPLLDLLIREIGTPRQLAGPMQYESAVAVFREAADLIEERVAEERIANSVVAFEPVGVVGLIVPWNYPLYQTALKVAPALATGCSVVLKPSSLASLIVYALAEVIHDIGLPPGVFNVVTGAGSVVGEALAAHPGIDLVSFTGSVAGGRRVAALASQNITKVTLELGGKGASLILEDGDVLAALKHATRSCFGNAGQTCAAMTRLIVPRSRLGEVEEAAIAAAAEYVPGDPLLPETRLGPLISPEQRRRVLGYIGAGLDQGARLLVGGADPALVPDRGYYVAATVFTDVTPDMTIAEEEIFGPVLAIEPVDDIEEAIRVADGTPYGLTSAVWSADPDAARRVGERLRVGSVAINGGRFNPSAPFGGRKDSGYGRERGRFGLEEYLTPKAYHY